MADKTTNKKRIHELLLLGIWLGLIIGISFIEAPLKFQAPGITTELGVGIGRLVFGVSNKIQLGLLFILIGLQFVQRIKRSNFVKFTFLVLVLNIAIQMLVLLPILDERATLWLSGSPPEDSIHHILFVILEVLKIICLTILFYKNHE